MKFDETAEGVEIILSDVDGVLTDGSLEFDNQGIETKRFHARDGMGVKLWRRAGYKFGVITSRTSQIVRVRAAELEMDIVRQGVEEKLPACMEIIAQLDLEPRQVCYIGDDLNDLPLIRRVGLGVAVADACSEVQAAASFVTRTPGGHGAVRELIERLLKSKKRWDDLVKKYLTQ